MTRKLTAEELDEIGKKMEEALKEGPHVVLPNGHIMPADVFETATGMKIVTPETDFTKLKLWKHNERQLAAEIIKRYDRGELEADGKRDAVIKYAGQYYVIDKNGNKKKVNPESLWRSYYQQTQ